MLIVLASMIATAPRPEFDQPGVLVSVGQPGQQLKRDLGDLEFAWEMHSHGQYFDIAIDHGTGLEESGDVRIDRIVVAQRDGTRRWEFASDGRIVLPYSPNDYDGDGNQELFGSHGSGGSCCRDQEFMLAIDGGSREPVWVAFPVSDHGTLDAKIQWQASVAEFVREDRVAGRFTYRWQGSSLFQIAHSPPLATLAQITGRVERWYDGPPETRELRFDLDGDGQDETMTCDISAQWGNLEHCQLPRPNGLPEVMALSCERLGVLIERHHGVHLVVCDARIVLAFDGHTWSVREAPR